MSYVLSKFISQFLSHFADGSPHRALLRRAEDHLRVADSLSVVPGGAGAKADLIPICPGRGDRITGPGGELNRPHFQIHIVSVPSVYPCVSAVSMYFSFVPLYFSCEPPSFSCVSM